MPTDGENTFTNEPLAEKFIQDTLQKSSFKDGDEAKRFIQAIYYCRNQGGRNLKTLAQTLETNIKTVFNSSHKYIYELLQNADDVGATEVELDIQGETLLFSHSGSHFRPSDVEKICDNAQPSGNKSGEIDKTGYKGVGFKANFCISNKITVLSQQVCFRFDQAYFAQPLDYPWPIMPIWTEKDPFLSALAQDKVHFYLEKIDAIKVRREIEEIFKSPEVLLLLRHINCVTLRHLGLKVMRVKNGGQITLEKIENETSIYRQQYSLYEYRINIPGDQKEYLKRLSPSECPEKLKIAEAVTITFAVKLNGDGLPEPAKKARLYAYLPTDILSGLPFWVNTEFLLKQDRGQLLDNSWNQYLMHEIGKLQFTVLQQIAKNPLTKNKVLGLLPPDGISTHELAYFRGAYKYGFEAGFNTIAFIPSIANTLLRRDQCIIDEHQFFSKTQGGFTETPCTQALFSNLWNASSALIVEPLLGSPENLKKSLGIYAQEKLFSAQKLVAKLAHYMGIIRADATALSKLWLFLLKAEDVLLKALKEQPWLLLKSGALQIAEKCFLPIQSTLDPDLSELEIIDERIFPDTGRDAITDWLKTYLSVGNFTWHDVIKIYYPKLIAEHKVDKPRAIRMLWHIYNAYQHKVISEEIIKQLGDIFPIQIGTTVTSMNQCMMPLILVDNNTGTESSLVRIPNDYFLGNNYDANVLRGLLIGMGVRTELSFIYYADESISNARLNYPLRDKNNLLPDTRPQRIIPYTAYCREEYSQKISSLFETPSHRVKNFFDCDFIEKISLSGYKEIFWGLMIQHFSSLSQTKYSAPRQGSIEIEIVSPIIFYLKTYHLIKAKGKDGFYRTTDLYMPAIAQLYEESPLLVADIPQDIPTEILKALGFKIALTLEDAMILLESETYRRSPKMLQFIYRAILSAYEKTTVAHQTRIDAFLQRHTLLTTRGVLKKYSNIHWMDMLSEPSTDNYFFIDPCGLSFDEMRDLAQIFKLKSFSRESLDTLSTTSLQIPQEAEEICQQLKLKILDFLHIAAIHVVIQNGIHTPTLKVIEAIAENLYQKLLTLKLTCCDNLCFSFEKMTVSSDAEFAKDKVVIKGHELLFTKQAFDNESADLVKALAKMIFETENLREEFVSYMDKPTRIRRQELKFKDRGYAEALAQAKLFFESRKQRLSAQSSLSHAKISSSAIEETATHPPIYSNGGHLPTLWNAARPSAIGSNAAKIPSRSRKEIAKTEQNIQTGYEGEKHFYDYLQEQTLKLFRNPTIEETQTGYIVRGCALEVIWFNKEKEQGKAMDFEVKYQDQRYIFEIKTTVGADMHAFISRAEVKQLQEHKGNYALVFVFGNGDIRIRWNPDQKISDNILRLIPIQYQIELTQNHDEAWSKEEHHVDKGCVIS